MRLEDLPNALRETQRPAVVAEVRQAIDYMKEADARTRPRIRDAVRNVQEAVTQQASERIEQGIMALRTLMQEVIELRPLPSDPQFFSAVVIEQIEIQCGAPIDAIPSGDRRFFRVTIEDIEYCDRLQNLFYRIANNFLKKNAKATDGRLYLALRKQGATHDKAARDANANVDESFSGNIPVKESAFVPKVIRNIEQAMGKNSIMEISAKDRTTFTVEINGHTYSDVFQNLLYRVASALFKNTQPAIAKTYLALRGAGFSHEESKSMAIAKHGDSRILDRKSRVDSIPVNQEFLSQSVVLKIKKALEVKDLDEVSVRDERLFTIHEGNKKYSDKFVNLLERICVNIFQQKQRARARAFLVLLDKGVKYQAAVKKSAEMTINQRDSRDIIPVREEFMTQRVILLIEEQLEGEAIENISVGDKREFTIQIDGNSYTDTIVNLLHRVADHLFRRPSLERARTYLSYIKQGMNAFKAYEKVIQTTKEKPKKERNNNTIPVEESLFSAEIIAKIEAAIGSIETADYQSEEKFTLEIDGHVYEDRMRSFFMRIARKFCQSENGRVGRDYIVMCKKGMPREAARSNIANPVRHPIPCDAALFTPAFIGQVLKAAGVATADQLRAKDSDRFTLQYQGKTYVDSGANLMLRITAAFFPDAQKGHARGQARSYLHFRYLDADHDTAIRLANIMDCDELQAYKQGRLPIKGIQSSEEAVDLLRKEILRLRRTGTWIAQQNAGKISKDEYAEIASPAYVEKNAVVRVVTSYLQSLQTKKK